MLIYLDSSAIVKLCRTEDQTEALRTHLGARPGRFLVASALAIVEVCRTLARDGIDPESVMSADGLLLQPAMLSAPVLTLEIAPGVLRMARDLPPPVLRTLDAIHIATAKLAGASLDHLISYDKRMISAAEAADLAVATPG